MTNILIFGEGFNNLLWFVITYGSSSSFLLGLFLIPYREGDTTKILKFLIIVTAFEVLLGYSQMAITFSSLNPFSKTLAAGDYFRGTLGNLGLAHLAAAKISLVALFMIPVLINNISLRNFIITMFLIVGWLLPSALYTIILGGLAILIYYSIFIILPKVYNGVLTTKIFLVIVIFIVGFASLYVTQKSNLKYVFRMSSDLISTWEGKATDDIASQKLLFYRTAIFDLPYGYPHAVLVGVGPGNFASRAAWIISGYYLESQPAFIKQTTSEPAKALALPYMFDIVDRVRWGAGSISHQPFSSWISIYSELGIFAVIILALLLLILFREARFETTYGHSTRILIIYLFLFMFADNILEYPQFMTQLGCLVIPALLAEKNKH